jgi:hypothetical protein
VELARKFLVKPLNTDSVVVAITGVCPEAAVTVAGGGNADPKYNTLLIAAHATNNVTRYKHVSFFSGVIIDVLSDSYLNDTRDHVVRKRGEQWMRSSSRKE